MKKQIIVGIGIIACVALCAVVWQWNAEVEDLPAEPVKAAVSAEIEVRPEETPHIFISKDVPEPKAEVITEDEPGVTGVTPEEKTEKPTSTPSLKPQAVSKSAPASTELKSGDRTY